MKVAITLSQHGYLTLVDVLYLVPGTGTRQVIIHVSYWESMVPKGRRNASNFV